MGVYEKIGLRNIGIKVSEFITWTRNYGAKDAFYINRKLFSNKNEYTIKPSFVNYPLQLRGNYSDKAIFMQVFMEKQYALYGKDFPRAKTIIDGGANIGMASIYFSMMFPDAAVVAIEPDDKNFKLLETNTSSYKNIKCFKNAIWHTTEELHIKNPEMHAAEFMVEKSDDTNSSLKGISIDEIIKLNSWQQADIVKLDIEGAEKEVFSLGKNDWLNKTKLLIIELHDRYKKGCTKAFFEAINKYDYEAYFHHENIFIFLNQN